MNHRSSLLVSAFAVALYGLVCLLSYPREVDRAAAVQRLTCAEFLQQAPGINDYFTLTEVRLGQRGQAFWRDAQSPGDVDVFVPVYPAQLPQEPPAQELNLVLEVQDADSWQRLRGAGAVEFTCLVTQGSERIPAWAQHYLADTYRGLQFGKLTVLTVGLHEPTRAKAQSLLWSGSVATGLAGVLLCVSWLWREGPQQPGSAVEPE